ncbi:putative uncharacterized protein DDB_G0292438 [Protopterus annectens]|uniref:putative uncharacterized protein DDB_G0292438 n=1 Tax=Protopterus annectens TaxID=7888 RepID=UPI001CF99288|nr:putative uncharacterized protein DDB_G0292438 [Protopterus annectens]
MLIKYYTLEIESLKSELEMFEHTITRDTDLARYRFDYGRIFSSIDSSLAEAIETKKKKIVRDINDYSKGMAYPPPLETSKPMVNAHDSFEQCPLNDVDNLNSAARIKIVEPDIQTPSVRRSEQIRNNQQQTNNHQQREAANNNNNVNRNNQQGFQKRRGNQHNQWLKSRNKGHQRRCQNR